MGFDEIFDFDGDGKLNAIEQATAYEVLFGDEDEREEDGFRSSFDDDEDISEAEDIYDEYDEYEDLSGDEFVSEDEEEEEDLFSWDEDEEEDDSETGLPGKRKSLEEYKERLSKIVDLIYKITSDADDLLFDLDMDLTDTDEKYEMIEALENAKLDLDLLTVDLENILEQ